MGPVHEGRARVSRCAGARTWATAALLLVTGCATTVRLDDKFDTDPLGGPPVVMPPPSPPNDVLSFTSLQQVTNTIEASPAGGRWLHITPNTAFTQAPDARKRALIATTEPLTTNPQRNVRGHLRVRLDGTGTVYFGLQVAQGAQRSHVIAGVAVAVYPLSPAPKGQVFVLGEHPLASIEDDIFGLPSRGKLADYVPGTPISIHWSIDQVSRTFNANVAGGTPQSTTFADVSAGVTTTPMQQLSLFVWLERPADGMSVFLDDLFVEELR